MPNEYNPQQCGNSKHLRNKMLMYSALHSDMQQFIRERYWCYEPIGTLGQNIPSNSTYAKLIKSCVQAPDGWLFVGLDFASLEDRISALTTKDENKLKVYLQNYDGHCLRACAYFEETMPDIVEKREEIAKEGQTYKVVYSDGSVEYLNEFNPNLLKALQELKGK